MEPLLGDRTLFPKLEARAYLGHASVSPASQAVEEAVAAMLAAQARRGVGALEEWLPVRRRLRERLARLLGCAPEDLALVPNTTQGVLDVALCFPWNPGDRVLVFQGEFPANVTPWQQVSHLFGLEVHLLPLARLRSPDVLHPLESALQKGARMVAVSAVQFQTGLRMPLEEIGELCRRYGATFFVDGIQALGVVPLDVRAAGIDFLASGSHKWLMGLEGVGFLYVAPCWLSQLKPRVAGWLSHEEPLRFLLEGGGHLRYDRPIRKQADFLEIGSGNLVGHVALEASVALIESLGVGAIHAHVNRYLDALEQGLESRGFASFRPVRRSGILSVLPPAGWAVPELAHGLARRGVVCNTPDGLLRFSPHWPNRLDEVPLVLEALDEIMAGRTDPGTAPRRPSGSGARR